MKLLLLVLVYAASLNLVLAQSYKTISPFDANYKVELKKETDGSYKVTVNKQDGTETKGFFIKPLIFDQFKVAFKSAHPTITSETFSNAEIDVALNRLFLEAYATLVTDETNKPLAGNVFIRKQIPIYKSVTSFAAEKLRVLHNESENKPSWYRTLTKEIVLGERADTLRIQPDQVRSAEVLNVTVEFTESFIENVIVETIDNNKRKQTFSNIFGIGFASKRNYFRMRETVLVETGGTSSTNGDGILLADVMRYLPELRLNTRDYSPADGTLKMLPSETPVALHKAETSKLFEARVYTDFVGVNEQKPNGLVQMEVFKRINTNTSRSIILRKFKLLRFILGEGGGSFQYVQPSFTLSKIEENNRYLNLSRLNDGSSNQRYAAAIDLLRYQQFSAGLDFNVFYTENISGKFNVFMDLGFRFGATPVTDSLTRMSSENIPVVTGEIDDFLTTNLQISLPVRMQWLPEERFSVILSTRPTFFQTLNPQISQTMYYGRDQIKPRKSDFLGLWELQINVKSGENGRIFARYRNNFQHGRARFGFHQLQLGYSFYILQGKRLEKVSE